MEHNNVTLQPTHYGIGTEEGNKFDELLSILQYSHPEIFGIISTSAMHVNSILVNHEDGWIIGSDGKRYIDNSHTRALIHIATIIKSSLPPVAEGFVRLWRGNRVGEVGLNPSYTNSLEGIALPFLILYRGPLSYVDVTEEVSVRYLCIGAVAPNSEFLLPTEIVKDVNIVGMSYEAAQKLKSLSKPEDITMDNNPWGIANL